MLIYILIAILCFASFLVINYKWLHWIYQMDDDTDTNMKLGAAMVMSLVWPLGVPIFAGCLLVIVLRTHLIPEERKR